ncbi:MAG TPA: glycosyltransferase family 1 protein [Acidimicrobiales bacterium]|nr:glycosyltransferase family 1 protein [Acidimicrobiales bacterium]
MTDLIRVGMNLLWLRPGIVGGSEVAAVSTAEALERYAASEVALSLYTQQSFPVAHPRLAGRVPTRTVGVPTGTRGMRVALESTWLPGAVRRDRIDVVHCYGGVVPPAIGRPSVLTLHDVQPLEAGADFGSTKQAWLTRMIPASVSRAAAVAVPSAFVRDRVLELFGTDPDKVVVVPHGLDTAMTIDPEDLPDPTEMRRRFRLDGPFVLYPAITYPHKNHATLVRAFARLAESNHDVSLVLTGGAGPAEGDVARLVEHLGIGDRVRRVGRVTTAERDVLLRAAAVLAFPSRYEGFGLPVLEAFGVDTPVVASSAGSLPEVVGDAGVLVDPDDVEGWADALETAIGGGDGDDEAARRRAAQIAGFSWRRSTTILIDLYRRAASAQESGR